MKPLHVISLIVAVLGAVMLVGAGIAALAVYGDLVNVLWTVGAAGAALVVAACMAATFPG